MRNPVRTSAHAYAGRHGPGAVLPALCRSALVLSALVLAACSLETAVPGYDPQISDRARAADWPELADESVFSQGAESLSGGATAEDIAARAEALRRRALLLRRPVISAQDEDRLQAAGQQ